jgi:hypothetical protein
LNPFLVINPPSSEVLSCYSFDILVENILFDGLRGLKQIEWRVVNITSTIYFADPLLDV